MIFWAAMAIIGGALAILIYTSGSGRVGDMPSDQFASLAFYAALGLVIGSGVVFAYRNRMGKAIRDFAIWALLILALVAGYGFRHDLKRFGDQVLAVLIPGYVAEEISGDGQISVTLRQRDDGHFVADTTVNGTSITMLVDTGASVVALSAEDAARAGLEIAPDDYVAPISTANGQTMAAPVRLRSISVGSIVFTGVRALVAQPGSLTGSLLGNSFLERLVSYQVEDDRLILRAER